MQPSEPRRRRARAVPLYAGSDAAPGFHAGMAE